MLTIKQRIFIFAFVISPVLYFGEANALQITDTLTLNPELTAAEVQMNIKPTITPAAAAAATAEAVAITTTTLASSNAPATTMEETQATRAFTQNGIDSNSTEGIDGEGEAAITTMLPENLQQATKMDDVMFTTLTTAILDDAGETTASNIKNEAKTEMKNLEEHLPRQGGQLPVAENPLNAHDEQGGRKLVALPDQRTPVTKKATIPVTPTVDADEDTPRSNIKFVGKLKNGLYRIKLAEIVTDEFDGKSKGKNSLKTSENKNPEKKEQSPNNKQFSPTAGKVNIADLYPMKKEDFDPLIRDSNAKEDEKAKEKESEKEQEQEGEKQDERAVFKRPADVAEYRQNLLPNEVESQQRETGTQNDFITSTAHPRPNRTLTSGDTDTISEFTGKLLADQDSIITEIEQKFRLNEFGSTESNKTTNASRVFGTATAQQTDNMTSTTTTTTATPTATTATTTTTSPPSTYSPLNREHFESSGEPVHHFIDKRVKKSFIFPMHRAASDVMSEPYVDFANTKFTGGSHALIAKTFTPDSATNGGNVPPSGVALTGAAHPEFSTTKFYNSKELYNEMIMHNRLKQLQNKSGTTVTAEQPLGNGLTETKTATPTTATPTTAAMTNAASRFALLRNLKSLAASKDSSSSIVSSVEKPVKLIAATNTSAVDATTSSATATATSISTEPSEPSAEMPLEISSVEIGKSKNFQKELKRAKLMLKVARPPKTKATTPSQTAADISENVAGQSVTTPNELSLTAQSTAVPPLSTLSPPMAWTNGNGDAYSPIPVTTVAPTTTSKSMRAVTNPTKSVSKPIARPRTLSSLQEKINLLECEIQNVPQDSHLWRGNETHELLLPIITPAPCTNAEQQASGVKNQHDCSTAQPFVSWEGESEIQSGDILIVEINDASLLKENRSTYSAHFTQVYQVTRSGHEHCDVTEGILLDITPLVVDGRKLVTLYDKDLTEGVNLLIVVSELWGSQCVRLKVTAKTDNCGENADCSGKGVCYSNSAMEEYECQCCSGFAGPHCEEIDACTPSPCTNNGICVDLSQGHDGNSYQCLCPYGYTGKNCQYEADPCNPAECMNGGSCVGNSTHFRCDCTAGFAGPLCQHSLNECESSPCVHGICVDQEDGFRCFCQPGFAGELCNFEYNECESNPCQNGGECIDHIGSFECRCTKGYTGNRCQIKVDFCANKPCPEGHRCTDHGNDFSCECPGGRNGPDCDQMARMQCAVNTCTHGGTCWSSGDTFYCACRPGYTGTMCEDEFVVETVVSSSEFIVDDVNAQNLNEKTFGSSVVLKSPVELHNAYFAAGVLAAAFFIVAVVVTICHCKVNQTYRKFSTRTTSFIPIIGFGRRSKPQNKLNKHWLSGKGLGTGNSSSRSASGSAASSRGQVASSSTALQHGQQLNNIGQLHERPFQKHLAMNLENDMYYTVDFCENSQHSPLIQ